MNHDEPNGQADVLVSVELTEIAPSWELTFFLGLKMRDPKTFETETSMKTMAQHDASFRNKPGDSQCFHSLPLGSRELWSPNRVTPRYTSTPSKRWGGQMVKTKVMNEDLFAAIIWHLKKLYSTWVHYFCCSSDVAFFFTRVTRKWCKGIFKRRHGMKFFLPQN